MADPTPDAPELTVDALAAAADSGDAARLYAVIEPAPPLDVVRALARLEDEQQARTMTLLAPADAAELLLHMADVQAADVLEELAPADAAAILHALPSNDEVDIVNQLHPDDAAAILAELEPAEATTVRTLADYDENVAGGLMVAEYLAFRADEAVAVVVEELRREADTYADYQVQYVYVVDAARRLVGVVRLRDLLLARPGATVARVMIDEPLAVRDDAPLDELEIFFDDHPFLGVPVVDADGRLVGLLRRSDVEEALTERADSDYRKAQGIVGGEELRSMPVLLRAGRRLSWLSTNIVLNLVAASVIAAYQDTLAAVIALAVFLPIISDMSGCSGNQAVAVSMRELALGVVRPNEALHVWGKEISVGLINGTVLGLLLGAVAWWWQGNPWLGLVVGAALALNTVVAVSIGGSVPLVLKRFGLDPALSSGPILTTVTDLCGFFLSLSFATVLLARLVAA